MSGYESWRLISYEVVELGVDRVVFEVEFDDALRWSLLRLFVSFESPCLRLLYISVLYDLPPWLLAAGWDHDAACLRLNRQGGQSSDHIFAGFREQIEGIHRLLRVSHIRRGSNLHLGIQVFGW
jgi:hypothetical protein